MIFDSRDMLERKALKAAKGMLGKAKSVRIITRAHLADRDAGMDERERMLAEIDAIWADFRSFCRNPPVLLDPCDDIPF